MSSAVLPEQANGAGHTNVVCLFLCQCRQLCSQSRQMEPGHFLIQLLGEKVHVILVFLCVLPEQANGAGPLSHPTPWGEGTRHSCISLSPPRAGKWSRATFSSNSLGRRYTSFLYFFVSS